MAARDSSLRFEGGIGEDTGMIFLLAGVLLVAGDSLGTAKVNSRRAKPIEKRDFSDTGS